MCRRASPPAPTTAAGLIPAYGNNSQYSSLARFALRRACIVSFVQRPVAGAATAFPTRIRRHWTMWANFFSVRRSTISISGRIRAGRTMTSDIAWRSMAPSTLALAPAIPPGNDYAMVSNSARCCGITRRYRSTSRPVQTPFKGRQRAPPSTGLHHSQCRIRFRFLRSERAAEPDFTLTERLHLEAIAEGFNLTNQREWDHTERRFRHRRLSGKSFAGLQAGNSGRRSAQLSIRPAGLILKGGFSCKSFLLAGLIVSIAPVQTGSA